MSSSRDKAVRRHRRRLRERGIKRVEIEAAEADASLIRQLAKLLREGGATAERARRELIDIVAPGSPGLKELLASAPLAGIRIARSRDRARKIDL